MRAIFFLSIFLVACNHNGHTPIATVTCADNAPSCLSAPSCLGNVVGTACGSAGGMCTALPAQPLLSPCCACDNTVRIDPVEDFEIERATNN